MIRFFRFHACVGERKLEWNKAAGSAAFLFARNQEKWLSVFSFRPRTKEVYGLIQVLRNAKIAVPNR